MLLIINPAGAGEAIATVIKNFLTYNKPETQMKYFGNTLVKNRAAADVRAVDPVCL